MKVGQGVIALTLSDVHLGQLSLDALQIQLLLVSGGCGVVDPTVDGHDCSSDLEGMELLDV